MCQASLWPIVISCGLGSLQQHSQRRPSKYSFNRNVSIIRELLFTIDKAIYIQFWKSVVLMLDGTTENFFFLSCNNIFKVTSNSKTSKRWDQNQIIVSWRHRVICWGNKYVALNETPGFLLQINFTFFNGKKQKRIVTKTIYCRYIFNLLEKLLVYRIFQH